MKKFIVILLFMTTLISPRLGTSIEPEQMNEMTNLSSKVSELDNAGKYWEAIPYAEQLTEVTEAAYGNNHPFVAQILNNLAGLYFDMGYYEKAESTYKRALEIRKNKLGEDHILVAQSLSDLAKLYHDMERYAEAEAKYIQALEIREKKLGKEHLLVASLLNNLAGLYHEVGRYTDAETMHKRALEIRKNILGNEHILVAQSYCNLAGTYKRQQRYIEAEAMYKQAISIVKVLGENQPFVRGITIGLAGCYISMERYTDAEILVNETLRIEGLPAVVEAASYTLLGLIYFEKNRYADAEAMYKMAIKLYQIGNISGDELNLFTINLAVVYANTGRHIESHSLAYKASIAFQSKTERSFSILSEKQKLSWIEKWKGVLHGFLSHTSIYLQSNPSALTDTFNAWLKWKGAVMESQGRYIDALYHSDNPEIQKKFEELTNTRRELARLQLSKPEKMSFEDYRKRLEELEKKKEALEVELSKLSKDFALEKMVGKADAKKISEILPKDSVYIDFANIDMYDFKENKFGKSRYLAFVLIPGKEPIVKLIDIADTEDVDKHIKAYLDEIKEKLIYKQPPSEGFLNKTAKELYRLIMEPLQPFIKGKKTLYISPDGSLNLIPFEVLMSSDGKYLMEDYLINYVAAGRDIIRFTDTTLAKGDALIMADPDYDMGSKEKIETAKVMGVSGVEVKGEVSRDARDLRFKRLPETKKEADDIEKVLKNKKGLAVKNYQDKKAIEEILFKEKSPKILHLSTHGYFLKDEKVNNPLTSPFSGGLGGFYGEMDRLPAINIENPMLRSGIVFAGVNASLKEGRDDGMVSAEKILGLKLKGTELVVLSACETGIGDVKSGEGVFGLKRSFILSGAKTVVMSLWSVPSKETTELMTEFYTLWAEGEKTKAEALREAKQNLMKRKPNPFYWGAFVMVGNPE